MIAKKGAETRSNAADYDDDSDPKTWQALITNLGAGEWEVWATLLAWSRF